MAFLAHHYWDFIAEEWLDYNYNFVSKVQKVIGLKWSHQIYDTHFCSLRFLGPFFLVAFIPPVFRCEHTKRRILKIKTDNRE